MRGTKEMVEIMDSFEQTLKSSYSGYVGEKVERLDPHGRPVDGYPKDYFYTGGKTNDLFKMFMCGYMAGRINYM